MDSRNNNAGCRLFVSFQGWRLAAVSPILWMCVAGCYAPLHSDGIAARTLPDDFRWPQRTSASRLNYSNLVGPAPSVYLLGPGDRLELMVPDLIAVGNVQPFQVTVLDHGEIQLPRLGPVSVGGLSLAEAQQKINAALAGGLLQNPCAMASLIEKGTINVLVLGAVKEPGVHALPRYENDVAHAIAAAQGFTETAADVVEIHRRQQFSALGMAPPQPVIQTAGFQTVSGVPAAPQATAPQGTVIPPSGAPSHWQPYMDYRYGGHSLGRTGVQQPIESQPVIDYENSEEFQVEIPIMRIPLRGDSCPVNPDAVVLNASDVVIVPQKTDKVFYVVGMLSSQSRIRFSMSERDREIGNGLLLPDDREIDVVTAVVMAGYIDPIESPTTVTLHRMGQDGMPLLIIVDLIAARSDPKETVMVQSGDIIYLNPDSAWYTRRLVDRVIDRALGTAVGRWLTN